MRPFEPRALPRVPLRLGWIPAIVLHLVGVTALLRMPLGGRVEPTYIQLVPTPEPADLVAPDGASRGGPGTTALAGGGRRAPALARVPAPARSPTLAAPAGAPLAAPREAPPALPATPEVGMPPLQLGPLEGDGRLWVSPRPALPADVAAALYGTQEPADSVAVGRLRAMVDSLNEMIDSAQLARRPPSWTVGEGDEKWGIDPQFIHLGGIRIPTTILALLGDLLPPGNPTEAERAEQLARMRDDLLYSARRAQTVEDFRRYVRELRERKQAERDAARRARQPPDSLRPVP